MTSNPVKSFSNMESSNNQTNIKNFEMRVEENKQRMNEVRAQYEENKQRMNENKQKLKHLRTEMRAVREKARDVNEKTDRLYNFFSLFADVRPKRPKNSKRATCVNSNLIVDSDDEITTKKKIEKKKVDNSDIEIPDWSDKEYYSDDE